MVEQKIKEAYALTWDKTDTEVAQWHALDFLRYMRGAVAKMADDTLSDSMDDKGADALIMAFMALGKGNDLSEVIITDDFVDLTYSEALDDAMYYASMMCRCAASGQWPSEHLSAVIDAVLYICPNALSRIEDQLVQITLGEN